MAGLAALMTRKKRDRRKQLEELQLRMQDPNAMAELTGKEAEEFMKAKQAHETIKKMLIGKELLNQKSSKQSFDALSQVSYQDDEEESGKGGNKNAYSALYLGLVIICVGIVITFVGLGEKGFKTLELKLIGPILCVIGLLCIVLKTIQCSFPHLFQIPSFLRRRKLADKDRTSLMDKDPSIISRTTSIKKISQKKKNGKKDGKGESSTGNTSIGSMMVNDEEKAIPSPRVILKSNKNPMTGKSLRPGSGIPNYIEASSDDDDDFNPHKKSQKKTSKDLQMITNVVNTSAIPVVKKGVVTVAPAAAPPGTIIPVEEEDTPTTTGIQGQGSNNTIIKGQGKPDQIILNPKALLI